MAVGIGRVGSVKERPHEWNDRKGDALAERGGGLLERSAGRFGLQQALPMQMAILVGISQGHYDNEVFVLARQG